MGFGFENFLKKGKRGQISQEWNFDSRSTLLAPPVISELNGSGQKSIIFGTSDGKVYCLAGDGDVNWMFNAQEKVSVTESMFLDEETANSIDSSPTVIDLNEDGKKEIIFGSEMGIVYALSPGGKILWKFKADGSIRGKVVVTDVNGDGKLEVIFGSGDKNLYILDNEGKLLHKHEARQQIESTPGIINDKIIFGCNNGEIVCVRFTGEELWRFKTDGKVISEPAIGKVYGTQENYIVIGSFDQNMYMLDEEGELIWKFKTNGAIYSKPALEDLNNDDKLEVIFGSCDNCVYALESNGEKIWSYETDFWVVAPVLVSDVDGDGKLEIIAGSYDHNLYILDAKGNYRLDYVPGLSGIMQQAGSYTDIVTSEPGSISGKKIWQFQTDGVIVGCAFIDDSKNIIINTRPGKVDNLGYKTR